jgi:hypothetical protein
MKKDPALDVLLDLNGEEFHEENGYWYKIEVSMVDPTMERPHGIRYNLTLHDNHNLRIMGFDNAHAVKSKKKGKFKGRIVEYDHLHKDSKDKGTPYEFSSAEQLLSDFFDEVNRILKEITK